MDQKTTRHEDLWQDAAESLSNKDIERIDLCTDDRETLLKDILEILKEKQQQSVRKRWRYTKNSGEEIVLREVFAKIAHRVAKVKDIGDGLVQYDPHHAAIPWAAIRLVLQVGFLPFGFSLRTFDYSSVLLGRR